MTKTWFIDLDGTVFFHNGYLSNSEEQILDNFIYLYNQIKDDRIIFVSSREEKYREQTENSLNRYGIKFHLLILGLPHGERIVLNDKKPDGLMTAYSVSFTRDNLPLIEIESIIK
jgi:hypothetical protein